MIVRFTRTVILPSGNEARNFRVNDLGNGRVRIQYVYTDRRRNHQVARRFTVEFLNGKVETIQARSANGGRVEFFKSSSIINELLEMLAEFNEVTQDVAHAPAKVEAPAVESEQDDTSDILNTLKTVGGMVMVNMIITLATLGIIGYNL